MNYIDILGRFFPDVEVWCEGDPTVLADIQVQEGSPPLPTQAEFEAAYLKLRQEQMWLKIRAERDRRYYQGIYVVAEDGNSYWFWTDIDTRGKYSMYDIAIRNNNLPQEFVLDNWKTMSGVFTPMTVRLLYRVINAAINNEKVIFNRGESKNAEMMALSDPESYDPLVGWPECYSDTVTN